MLFFNVNVKNFYLKKGAMDNFPVEDVVADAKHDPQTLIPIPDFLRTAISLIPQYVYFILLLILGTTLLIFIIIALCR